MKKQTFFNRELSWIEFNARVLEEAYNPDTPLLEKLKFLTIASSNFDEFFMVRVAGLKQTAQSQPDWRDASGLTAKQQLKKISERVHQLTEKQHIFLNKKLLPALAQEGIVYVAHKDYSPAQRHYLENLFNEEIFPLLTPLRAEKDQPFPFVDNLRLHAAFLLKAIVEKSALPMDFQSSAEEEPLALVQLPRSINRVVFLPSTDERKCFTLADDIISLFGTQLFPGYSVIGTLLFKPTCVADFAVDEDASGNFIKAMEEVLYKRQSAWPIKLVCSSNTNATPEETENSRRIRSILAQRLNLSEDDIYDVQGVTDISSLTDVTNIDGFLNLKNPSWKNFYLPEFEDEQEIWNVLKQRDVLLTVPYQSYDPVVRFINQAAEDPGVLAIKMTLYRTSGNSPIVAALEQAARNGKQVTVFVELKARFDERRNISWATQLEHAGVIVVHGIVNLKVHAKAMLIVRREETGIRRYVHLSTGNYNENTARLYSDLSLFTANNQIAGDITIFFNMISGYSAIQTMNHLFMAPINLKSRLLAMIEREIQVSTPENPGLIMAKMNSLAHEEIISALYRASNSNVRVLLNVRGICMLVPGVTHQSDNISVVSIVDRFLEHSRIVYFQNGGAEELYLSSADWMPRNLDKRVELMFPVLQKDLFAEVKNQLQEYFKDNSHSYQLMANGSWLRKKTGSGEKVHRAQESLYQEFKRRTDDRNKAIPREFIVRRNEPN